VSQAFQSLHVGDKLQMPAGGYVATGRMTLRTPDGSTWSEWLLAPATMSPADAIASLMHRWLAWEPESGLLLWAPVQPPPGFGMATVSEDSWEYLHREYRVQERDSMRVEHILGDVGGDATAFESFDFVDLASGSGLMSVEGNARGVDLYLGRRIPDDELVGWARAGGNPLPPRYGALPASPGLLARSLRDGDDGGTLNPLKLLAYGGGLVVALLLARCDRDQDCEQVRNASTGKMEQVCHDGLRSNNGRQYGGAGGK
jgi:hypothetical protein